MDAAIGSLDPPVAPLVGGAGAVNVTAGVLLLIFSELIHNVIGVVLIALGLFLIYYSRKVARAVASEMEMRAQREAEIHELRAKLSAKE